MIFSEKPDLVIDLSESELQLSYNKNPNLFRQQVDDLVPGEAKKILIDEIQRVPKLLNIVYSLVEQRPDLQFILCGSSSRKLGHGASNLLGGRVRFTGEPNTVWSRAGLFVQFVNAPLVKGWSWREIVRILRFFRQAGPFGPPIPSIRRHTRTRLDIPRDT